MASESVAAANGGLLASIRTPVPSVAEEWFSIDKLVVSADEEGEDGFHAGGRTKSGADREGRGVIDEGSQASESPGSGVDRRCKGVIGEGAITWGRQKEFGGGGGGRCFPGFFDFDGIGCHSSAGYVGPVENSSLAGLL